jgi:cytochrome c553
MKLIKSAIAILAIVSSSVPSLAGPMEAVNYGESFANRNCAWCHGPSLQGFATAPRLAGQTRQYIYNQLRDFRAHTRDNPLSEQYMWGAAANHLSSQTAHDLAVYFSTLNAESANDGDKGLAAGGQTIYREGIPASNIPSCVACHGPNAEGAGAEGAGEIPRLGGLSYHYLKRRLEQWGEGYHAAAAPPMPGIASQLSANEIEALASYLSFVK